MALAKTHSHAPTARSHWSRVLAPVLSFGFLNQLSDANGNQGRINIEVPYFDWTCRNHAWFEIDKSIPDKILITVAHDGFLKRIA